MQCLGWSGDRSRTIMLPLWAKTNMKPRHFVSQIFTSDTAHVIKGRKGGDLFSPICELKRWTFLEGVEQEQSGDVSHYRCGCDTSVWAVWAPWPFQIFTPIPVFVEMRLQSIKSTDSGEKKDLSPKWKPRLYIIQQFFFWDINCSRLSVHIPARTLVKLKVGQLWTQGANRCEANQLEYI